VTGRSEGAPLWCADDHARQVDACAVDAAQTGDRTQAQHGLNTAHPGGGERGDHRLHAGDGPGERCAGWQPRR
jgi:hypothetical protein